MRRFAAPALFAAALLTFGAATVHAKDDAPVALDASFKPALMADKVFTVAEAAAFQGLRKVVVPLFTVEFVTADSARAETSGFAAAGRASAASYYKLKGVDEADFQAITTALYADFLRDLRAAGLEVVAADTLAASPTYRKLVASGSPAPLKADASITLAPPGMAIYGMNKATANGGGSSSMFGALSAIGNSIGAMSAVIDTVELQKELGAAVLEVQLKVHFVNLVNNNKGFLGRLGNTASVDATVTPRITNAMLSVQTAATRGALTLQHPLLLDASAIAEVRSAPTTAADVAGGVAVALIRLAARSSDSSSTEQMEAVADPAKYREVVGGGLGAVREMFVQRLRPAS